MDALVVRLGRRMWPDLDSLDPRDRARLLSELSLSLLNVPLVVLSLVLLGLATDLSQLAAQAPAILLVLVLGYTLSQINFFQTVGKHAGEFSFNSTNLGTLLLVSALLVLGPLALWPYVLLTVTYRVTRWPKLTRVLRWNWLRNTSYNLWATILSTLGALALYEALGGGIPLAGLSFQAMAPAFAAVTALILLNTAFLWALFAIQPYVGGTRDRAAYRASAVFFLLSEIPGYFGVLAAGLYSQAGIGAYVFFMAGVILTSLLARRLSLAAMLGQQRSREAALLEQLGRAIIDGPPDASTLPSLLAQYVPGMFPHRHISIRLFQGNEILHAPADSPGPSEALWPWLNDNPANHVFEPEQPLPWTGQAQPYRYLLSPILLPEQSHPVGGICVVQDGHYTLDTPIDLQPAIQALAAQIASTLRSAESFQKTLEHQKMAQELSFAGQIQASFLPDTLPRLQGWQLAATLQPARETSGDFYDAFPLPNGKLGLLVADVSDKGMGAALYMALVRTLLRTYAYEYHARPDDVLRVANRRILADTQAGLFVSVFYAVVDPYAGTLAYANAGHCPAFLLRPEEDEPKMLPRTGMVLGVMESATWEQVTVPIAPGNVIVFYSDGVTDAQNSQEEFFGDERLRAVLCTHKGLSAHQIQEAILAELQRFCGVAPRFDDITVMVLERRHVP